MTPPVVSIVVPSFGRPELLARCLASIASTVDIPHEVICVTVASTETQLRCGAVTVINQPTPTGFVRAANLGVHAATGTYVTILNDDCTLLPHSLANAVRFLEVPAHENVGQAAFFHDTPVRRNVYAQIDVEGVRYAVCHVRGLCYANFGLARREVYERLGGLDERFFMYGADPDFSLRIWHEAGLSVVPCPGALVHHEQAKDDRATRERAGQSKDNDILFHKWGMRPAPAAALE